MDHSRQLITLQSLLYLDATDLIALLAVIELHSLRLAVDHAALLCRDLQAELGEVGHTGRQGKGLCDGIFSGGVEIMGVRCFFDGCYRVAVQQESAGVSDAFGGLHASVPQRHGCGKLVACLGGHGIHLNVRHLQGANRFVGGLDDMCFLGVICVLRQVRLIAVVHH